MRSEPVWKQSQGNSSSACSPGKAVALLAFSWLIMLILFDLSIISKYESVPLLSDISFLQDNLYSFLSAAAGLFALYLLSHHIFSLSLYNSVSDGVSVGSVLRNLDVSAIHSFYEAKLFTLLLSILTASLLAALSVLTQINQTCSCAASGLLGPSSMLWALVLLSLAKAVIDSLSLSMDFNTFLELRKLHTQALPNMAGIVGTICSFRGVFYVYLGLTKHLVVAVSLLVLVQLSSLVTQDECREECPEMWSDIKYVLMFGLCAETFSLCTFLLVYAYSKRSFLLEAFLRIDQWISNQNNF